MGLENDPNFPGAQRACASRQDRFQKELSVNQGHFGSSCCCQSPGKQGCWERVEVEEDAGLVYPFVFHGVGAGETGKEGDERFRVI